MVDVNLTSDEEEYLAYLVEDMLEKQPDWPTDWDSDGMYMYTFLVGEFTDNKCEACKVDCCLQKLKVYTDGTDRYVELEHDVYFEIS